MARKSLEQKHRGFNTGAVASAATPTTCPICGETPVVAKGEKRRQFLEAHLIAQHRTDVPCRREHRGDADATWRLDFDAVLHHAPTLWFCSECGFYRQAD